MQTIAIIILVGIWIYRGNKIDEIQDTNRDLERRIDDMEDRLNVSHDDFPDY